ncbi:DUF1295 domain-containing protein [bacterium]|nr:DUF1295 domain-containing protein [bacterium]
METLALLLAGLVFSILFFSAVWPLSLWTRDASIVDRFWGLSYVFLFCFYLLAAPQPSFRSWGVFALVALWGLRLSWHIHQRNHRKGEDARYAEMRRRAGAGFGYSSLWSVFWLQAVLAWFIGLPLVLAAHSPRPGVSLWDIAGIVFWLTGFVFEAVGDAQLRAFKRDPKNSGKILDTGLWALTRHPNYFGDACVWWGFYCFGAAASPYGVWLFACPWLMTFFLTRVSGVVMLEETLTKRLGYAEYARRTPAFFPRLPFKGKDSTAR